MIFEYCGSLAEFYLVLHNPEEPEYSRQGCSVSFVRNMSMYNFGKREGEEGGGRGE